MGLDICVFQPIKAKHLEDGDLDSFFILDENSELQIFSDFAFKKNNEYYDTDAVIAEMGYSMEDLHWIGTTYAGKKVSFDFYDTKHPLYATFLQINAIWDKTYFSSLEELRKSQYWKDYQKSLPLLKKYGWKQRYKFFATGNQVTYYNFVHLWNFLKKKCMVSVKNPRTVTREETCIAYVEVGYQRKGANKQFYDDGKWGSPCVTDKKTLLEHWEKYFSDDEERKADFKRNIVDKFVEGVNFVCYC